MAYCIAKSIEIQRSKALKEIFLEGRSVAQVARRFGRNRSTFYCYIYIFFISPLLSSFILNFLKFPSHFSYQAHLTLS